MVTARASTRTPAAPRKATRATRTAAAPPSPTLPTTTTVASADDLASDLERVLKIAQPQPKTAAPSRRTVTSTVKVPAKAESSTSASSRILVKSSTECVGEGKATGLKSEATARPVTEGRKTIASRSIKSTTNATAPTTAVKKPPIAQRPVMPAPTAVPSVRRNPPASTSASTQIPSEAKPRTAPSSSRALPQPSTSTTAPAARSASAATAVPRQPLPTTDNRKGKAPMTTSATLARLPPDERARQTMAHINEVVQQLSEITKGGYTYASGSAPRSFSPSASASTSQSSASRNTGVRPTVGAWTDAKVAALFEDVGAALRDLRRLADSGEIKDRRVDIEKAAMGVALRCVNVKMYRKALDFIADARPNLLKMYAHQGLSPVPPQTNPPTYGSSTGATAKSGPRSRAVPTTWQDVTRLPKPRDFDALDSSVKLVLFQSLVYSYIALASLQEYDVASLFVLPRQATYLHPFTLALHASLPTITPLLHLLYRRIADQTKDPSDPVYTQLQTVALLGLATSISGNKTESSNTPAQLWGAVHRTAVGMVEKLEDEERLKKANELVEAVVEWVGTVVATRKEEAGMWQEGNGWVKLMDLWASLGHKLNDSEIIDRALAGMIEAVNLTTEAKMETGMSSAQAVTVVYRVSAELAKLNLMLEDNAGKPKEIDIVLVDTCDFEILFKAFVALGNNEEGIDALGKGARAIERIRRLVVKIPESANRDQPDKVTASLMRWLERHVCLVENVIRAAAPVLSSTARDFTRGALDTLVVFTRWSNSSTDLAAANRLYHLCASTRSILPTRTSVLYLVDASTMTWNAAVKRYNTADWAGAALISTLSCEWIQEAKAMAVYDSEEGETPQVIERVFGSLMEKWDHSASLSVKAGDSATAVTKWLNGLASMTSPTFDKITIRSSSTPIVSSTFFSDLPALLNVFQRIYQHILVHTDHWETSAKTFTPELVARGVPAAVIGVVVEKLLTMLGPIGFKPKVGRIMKDLAESLLDVYSEEEYPVRRMRLRLRIMELVAATGVGQETLADVEADINHLSTVTDLGQDQALSPFQPEMKGRYLILRALNAYHTESDPSSFVLDLANEAIAELRPLVLPASTLGMSTSRSKRESGQMSAGVPKTPARGGARVVSEPARKNARSSEVAGTPSKIAGYQSSLASFDNLKLLSEQLHALAALLGLLGHVLAKIDVLKLLRALQRTHDELITEYTLASAELGTEYAKLGKRSRANLVFTQAIKHAADSKAVVALSARVNLHLRHSHSLALMGRVDQSRDEFSEAKRLANDIEPPTSIDRTQVTQIEFKLQNYERAALSHAAALAIRAAENNVVSPVEDLAIIYRNYNCAVETCARLAPDSTPSSPDPELVDPFIAPPKDENATGANEPSKDSVQPTFSFCLAGRHLGGLQWHFGESVLSSSLSLASAYAHRGSVKDAEYYVSYAGKIAALLRSTVVGARVDAVAAQIKIRQREYEAAEERLEKADKVVGGWNGPDAVEVKRAQGEMFAKQRQGEEAGEAFAMAVQDIAGLEAVFVAAEAMIPSPKRNGIVAHPSLTGATKEPLLPVALGHVLRQHAWILRQAGSIEESDELLRQIKYLPVSSDSKAEQLYLEGRIAMYEARNHFKADLFLNSLNESTIAMPMNNPRPKTNNRQSTRNGIQLVLQRAEDAFLSTLAVRSVMGRVEDVRQACMTVALLRAYQTSLGYGSQSVTAAAAGILASTSTITLKTELLDAINQKFMDAAAQDDLDWPTLEPVRQIKLTSDIDDEDERLRAYWSAVQARHVSSTFGAGEGGEYNVSSLPPDWAVVSINLTDDRKTLFISRHQNGHEPLVFCVPIDRQGKREGEDDDELFSFDRAQEEFKEIIEGSISTTKRTKDCVTAVQKQGWWADRRALDDRLKTLVESIEFYWLGAFKTILSPRPTTNPEALAAFRDRIDRIFHTAISATGSELKRGMSVPLNDPLLHCFATLPSRCKDEEIEDFIYFVLDLYQSHGISVALSELDLDQIGVDVRGAFADLENANARLDKGAAGAPVEHLLLALDKNVQMFPWESIPMLRGRPVSRIPSLPFLLDQVALGRHLQPTPSNLMSSSTATASTDGLQASDMEHIRREVDGRRTFYILNPSGDLKNTQLHFTPWVEKMAAECGWKGIVGRPPTELEIAQALREYDLVLYFGHGGAEQYIRSHKIRHLPKCATTMLWGCSSGILRDQGDFDAAGTPWNYVMAGCPSLVANLWDVTDRDIDRLSEYVCKTFELDSDRIGKTGVVTSTEVGKVGVGKSGGTGSKSKAVKSKASAMLKPKPIPGTTGRAMSIVEAVNSARDECRLPYLTGAAPVVYGIPVYLK